jgi:hypothetical protein
VLSGFALVSFAQAPAVAAPKSTTPTVSTAAPEATAKPVAKKKKHVAKKAHKAKKKAAKSSVAPAQ